MGSGTGTGVWSATDTLLVYGASMPVKGDLPGRFRDLTTRSGLRIATGSGFDASVDDLIQRLGGPTPQSATQPLGNRSPRGTSAWTTFEGYWQTRDGRMTEITQDGDSIELNGRDGNGQVAYQGRGQIQGGQAILEFATLGMQGRVVLQLVQNGAYINGQVQA